MPKKKKKTLNLRREFDPVGFGTDNSVVWRDYGNPPHYVITRGDENPRDVAERNEKREREQKARRES